jgi:hypothetical protein
MIVQQETTYQQGERNQYLIKVKDHKFHITDQFQEEIRVLEL